MTLSGSAPQAAKFTDDERGALYPLVNNLYHVHRDIVAVLTKWIPRRESFEEQHWLAVHLAQETREIPMYMTMIRALGFQPDARLRIPDSKNRYEILLNTESEDEVLVGMNVIAQGVLGSIEHPRLYRYSPEFFKDFVSTIAFDAANLERTRIMLLRRNHDTIVSLLMRYQRHLEEISIPELLPLLEPVFKLGIFEREVVDAGRQRLINIAESVGVRLEEVRA
jgi:hypothetical protein